MYDEKNVVMASLDRRTTLKFCELPDEQQIIKIEFSNIDLSLDVPLKEVRTFTLRTDMQKYIILVQKLLKYVRHFIDINGMWSTCEQRLSLQTFFFMLFYTAYTEKLNMRSFHVNVTTELPIRGGLGSSTSFA
ncbi:mevalonate kinase, partial [Lasius niger]